MLLSYLLLFASAFLAATILPFYSEVVLFTLIRQGEPVTLLIAIAAIGNTLGSLVNWYLGIYILKFRDRSWFYFKPAQINSMQHWFRRYGIWSLLFSWLPLGGDVLTLIAGVMRVQLWKFLLLVGIGKTLRYTAVVYAAQWSLHYL
jgi:membrane protein YqaA with SNARE-associated domain